MSTFQAYMTKSRRGLLFGNGPKETLSRTVVGSASIPFGRGVFGYAGDDKLCVVPQLDTVALTLSGVLVTDNVITLTINGVDFVETFTTSSDVTLDALVAQINATPGLSASRATLVITVTTKGITNVSTGVITLGATQATVTPAAAAISADLVFIGVAISTQKETNLPGVDDSYAPEEVASILSLGDIVVETDGTAVKSQTEAEVLATVAGVGKFSVSGGAGLAVEAWYKDAVEDDSTLMVVHLEGGITVVP